MKDHFSLSYFLLFIKFQLTISDSSYFYLLTNVLGAACLFSLLKNKKQKKLLIYFGLFGGVNVLLLALRLFNISVAGIPLLSFPSMVFSIFILVCYLYNFLFPIISLTELIKDSDNRAVQKLIKMMAFLSAFLLLTFYLFYPLTPILMFAIMVIEFLTLIKINNKVPILHN